jgi:hypothetical protein
MTVWLGLSRMTPPSSNGRPLPPEVMVATISRLVRERQAEGYQREQLLRKLEQHARQWGDFEMMQAVREYRRAKGLLPPNPD